MRKYLLLLFTINSTLICTSSYAQICYKYKLEPDTVLKNFSVNYEIQEVTGGITPPTLWVCNWIDFEGNSTQECTTSVSCSYSFTNSGLTPVLYEINEPFLNNTEVCTTMVFVSNCTPPTIEAKANGLSDTVIVCENSQLILTANPISGLSCTGNWQYSWFNGTTYYDGNGFLSFGEIWDSSFYSAQYDDIVSDKLFTLKVRCSDFTTCIDSSIVFVWVAPEVASPVFNQTLPFTRCQGADTLDISVTALNADSIKYSAIPLTSGIQLDENGMLIFDSIYSGIITLTASAYGCYGPKLITHQITTHPLPNVILNSDTTFMCSGDTILLPLLFSGTPPFNLNYNTETQTGNVITSTTNTYLLPVIADTSHIRFEFYQINDNNCSHEINHFHWVLSSIKPIYNPLSDTSLCDDASIVLDLGNNPYEYLWSHDSSTSYFCIIDTSLASIIIGTNIIYVSITNEYCQLTDSAEIFFTTCTDVNDFDIPDNLYFYPNPSSGQIRIDVPFVIKETVVFEVFSAIGYLMSSRIIEPSKQAETYQFNFKDKGIYFIRFSIDGYNSIVRKVIIN